MTYDAGPLLAAALECALDGLSVKPGRASLYPGGAVAWDQCDCDGQLWARLVSYVPAGRAENPGRISGQACAIPLWRASVAVGIIRCVATLTDSGEPPNPAQLSADTLAMTRDMAEIGTALQLCLADQVQQLTISEWNPLGPEGGCAGGEWSFTALVPNCLDG